MALVNSSGCHLLRLRGWPVCAAAAPFSSELCVDSGRSMPALARRSLDDGRGKLSIHKASMCELRISPNRAGR
eukprot:14646672-Alexandrium_andersonii.AAC.1